MLAAVVKVVSMALEYVPVTSIPVGAILLVWSEEERKQPLYTSVARANERGSDARNRTLLLLAEAFPRAALDHMRKVRGWPALNSLQAIKPVATVTNVLPRRL